MVWFRETLPSSQLETEVLSGACLSLFVPWGVGAGSHPLEIDVWVVDVIGCREILPSSRPRPFLTEFFFTGPCCPLVDCCVVAHSLLLEIDVCLAGGAGGGPVEAFWGMG